jgi:hypothetical protein
VSDGQPVVGPQGEGMAVVTMNEAFGELPDAVWLRRTLPDARLARMSGWDTTATPKDRHVGRPCWTSDWRDCLGGHERPPKSVICQGGEVAVVSA